MKSVNEKKIRMTNDSQICMYVRFDFNFYSGSPDKEFQKNQSL